MLMPKVGMVCMSVSDHCIVYRLPGVDVKPSLMAINAFIGKFKQWF